MQCTCIYFSLNKVGFFFIVLLFYCCLQIFVGYSTYQWKLKMCDDRYMSVWRLSITYDITISLWKLIFSSDLAYYVLSPRKFGSYPSKRYFTFEWNVVEILGFINKIVLASFQCQHQQRIEQHCHKTVTNTESNFIFSCSMSDISES